VLVELLDPRWKEQKAKAEARSVSTNANVDVATNLKRLVSQRGDVFDQATGQPISSPEEEDRRKRIALNSFDGTMDYKMKPGVGHPQSVNVEEQIRHIHEKFANEGHK
jgi:splicing factor 3A subunit 1